MERILSSRPVGEAPRVDLFTKNDLRALVNHSGRQCVTLYLPTDSVTAQRGEGPSRLTSLLAEAERGLRELSIPANGVNSVLSPAYELVDNDRFWQQQGDGLAIFLRPGFSRTYRVQFSVPESAAVGDRFQLKPLLPAITSNAHFHVVCIDDGGVRVYRGTPESLIELEIGGMPAAASRGPTDRNEPPLSYFRYVDHALHAHFDHDPGPMILSCEDGYYPLFRKVNSNPALLDTWIPAGVSAMPRQRLHNYALAIATAHFSKTRKEVSDQYLALWHTQRASNQLSDILPAALQGRVVSLLVTAGAHAWGHLNSTTNEATVTGTRAEGDDDLLNLTAIHTYMTGGAVYAVPPAQVPGGGDVAAVFRY